MLPDSCLTTTGPNDRHITRPPVIGRGTRATAREPALPSFHSTYNVPIFFPHLQQQGLHPPLLALRSLVEMLIGPTVH